MRDRARTQQEIDAALAALDQAPKSAEEFEARRKRLEREAMQIRHDDFVATKERLQKESAADLVGLERNREQVRKALSKILTPGAITPGLVDLAFATKNLVEKQRERGLQIQEAEVQRQKLSVILGEGEKVVWHS